jgi:hypothetical protein
MSDWVGEKRLGVPEIRKLPFRDREDPRRSVVCAALEVRVWEYTQSYARKYTRSV